MCVLMGPEVIINNAFWAKKEEERDCLDISELQLFCNILYDRITGKNDSGISYKYVCFQVSREDVEEFCREGCHYIQGIDKVYCIHGIEQDVIEKTNSIYPGHIQIILRNAREDFCRVQMQ